MASFFIEYQREFIPNTRFIVSLMVQTFREILICFMYILFHLVFYSPFWILCFILWEAVKKTRKPTIIILKEGI